MRMPLSFVTITHLDGVGKVCFFRAREPVKIWSEAEYFHNKPPAMRVVGKSL